MASSLFPLAIMALLPGFGQAVLSSNSSACASIASTFTHPNVTVNFATTVAAGTNISVYQSEYGLALCGEPSQLVPTEICRISLAVSTSNRSGIALEAWLPANWTGRFLSTGNGGLGGCIKYDDMAYGSSLGFATVGANNGHNGTRGLAFYGNEDVVTDFAWRSLYTETVIGKALTASYYGSDLKHSYYLGCSTGGRQGFKMAQDFPDLFDGIVAGAPAIAFNNLTSWSGRFLPITGTNTSDTFVSVSKWSLVHEDILKQCDGLDGVVDGILEDPTLCDYKAVGLLCASNATNTSACLTAKQVETVQGVLADYYGENGALIYPRMQPGAELADSNILYAGSAFPYTEDFFRYAILQDPTWNASTLNASTAAYAASLNPANIQTWKGDLSPFRDRGGKLLHYHGQMDSIISSTNSPRYYTHVATTMGLAPAELDNFYRFFRIGGMDHCSGGLGAWGIGQVQVDGTTSDDPQKNVLLRMVDWVEKGSQWAPESVTGVKYVNDTVSLGVDFERTHCKYPLRNVCVDAEKYKDPTSWRCVE